MGRSPTGREPGRPKVTGSLRMRPACPARGVAPSAPALGSEQRRERAAGGRGRRGLRGRAGSRRPPALAPPAALTRRRCWCRRRTPRTRCCGGRPPAPRPRPRRPAAPPARPCPPAPATPAADPRRLCARPSAWRPPSRSAPRLDPTHRGSPRGRAALGAGSAGKGSRRGLGGVSGERGQGAARRRGAGHCGACSPRARAAGHAGPRSLRRRGSEAVLAGKDAAWLLGNRSRLAGWRGGGAAGRRPRSGPRARPRCPGASCRREPGSLWGASPPSTPGRAPARPLRTPRCRVAGSQRVPPGVSRGRRASPGAFGFTQVVTEPAPHAHTVSSQPLGNTVEAPRRLGGT